MNERDAGAAGNTGPSVALSVAIFIVSTGLIAVAGLLLFDERFVTLSYGLPLLICLWHKDKRLSWYGGSGTPIRWRNGTYERTAA